MWPGKPIYLRWKPAVYQYNKDVFNLTFMLKKRILNKKQII